MVEWLLLLACPWSSTLCVLQNEADEDDETEEETYVPSDDVSDDEESSEEDSEESNWEDEDGSGTVVFYGNLFFHRFVFVEAWTSFDLQAQM